MDMPYWRSMLAGFLGVLLAAVVVTILCLLGKWGAIIASVVLLAVLAQTIVTVVRKRRE
jgi:hypothetical protein